MLKTKRKCNDKTKYKVIQSTSPSPGSSTQPTDTDTDGGCSETEFSASGSSEGKTQGHMAKTNPPAFNKDRESQSKNTKVKDLAQDELNISPVQLSPTIKELGKEKTEKLT